MALGQRSHRRPLPSCRRADREGEIANARGGTLAGEIRAASKSRRDSDDGRFPEAVFEQLATEITGDTGWGWHLNYAQALYLLLGWVRRNQVPEPKKPGEAGKRKGSITDWAHDAMRAMEGR